MEFKETLAFVTWFIVTVVGVAFLMAAGLWYIGIPVFILSASLGFYGFTS